MAARPSDELALASILALLGRERVEIPGERNYLVNHVEIRLRREGGSTRVAYAQVCSGGVPLTASLHDATTEDFGNWLLGFEANCVGGVVPPGQEPPDHPSLQVAVEAYRENGTVFCEGKFKQRDEWPSLAFSAHG